MTKEVKYPDIDVKLIGESGNAFFILGAVIDAMKEAGCTKEQITEYQIESTLGDYDNLLAVTCRYVNVY